MNIEIENEHDDSNEVYKSLIKWVDAINNEPEEDIYTEFNGLTGVIFKNVDLISTNAFKGETLGPNKISYTVQYESWENKLH